MTIETSSIMHTRNRRYGSVRRSDSGLRPIEEEQENHSHRRWGLVTLVTLASIAFVALLGFSASLLPRKDVKSHGSPSITNNRFIKSKKKHHKYGDSVCNDGRYSKRTLHRAYELPFAALFRDNRGQKKYEASAVIVVGEDAYAVCDSSWSISKFDRNLQPFSPANIQIGDPNREEEDSGYEALFYEDGHFYVVRESVNLGVSYHAVIEQLLLSETDYTVVQACPSEFEFEGNSKGFEGAVAVRDLNNELVVLGLCEGNYCSEKYKDYAGHGRIIAMKKVEEADGTCTWKTIKKINVPSSANFRDYSAMTMDSKGRVAITSQEESQLWVGRMVGQAEGGLWDIDALEFDSADAMVYDFPKDGNCQTVYCNIEGIHWLEDDMLMAVSDKMKSGGKQDFRYVFPT